MAAPSGAQIAAEIEKLGAGATYVFGGTGPTGYDCSGLVQAALEALGVQNVPRTSEEQYAWATPVSSPSVGDLVFANFVGTDAGGSPDHVGILVAPGEVFSAQSPSAGIGLSSLTSWKGSIVGYGQAPGTSAGAGSGSGGSGSGSSTVTGVQGSVPGVSAPGYTPSGAIIPGGTTTTPATPSSTGLPSILSGASGLLYDVSTALDYFFGMFGRGNGWRLVFAVICIVALLVAYKTLVAAGAIPGGLIPSAVPVPVPV